MRGPVVSILIVNWNTRERVMRCLASLPKDVPGLSREVIVIDNGSVDGSGEALARQADITLVRNERNVGYAAAVNQAYNRSSGELVLLLNSDVTLTSDALECLTQFLSSHTDAAAVGPLYVNPYCTPQPFHFRLPTFEMTLANGSALVRKLLPGSARKLRDYRMLDEDFSKPRPVPQPSASCLLLRRSFLPDDRIFDERYPIFFNDVQLARSFADRGFTLWVTPSAQVIHDAHSSVRMLGAAGKQQYLGSVVRMLTETESAAKVWLYRTVVFLQGIPISALGRSDALSVRALWKALSGDVGPLPSGTSSLRHTPDPNETSSR
jgi:GT2 family glycosyltransferase